MQQEQLSAVPEPQPTIIDALNEDANPKEYPKDAPALWPYLKLPFRDRAKFFSVYRVLQAKQSDLLAAERKRKRGKITDAQMLEAAEGVYDLYAMMDDLMRIAAVDKDAYDEWVREHNDDDFGHLFAVYVERSQPGEASSSAN